MIINLSRRGWFFVFRLGNDERNPIGFAIKPRSDKIFSERYIGYAHEMSIGPLYFRTYKRKSKADRDLAMANPKQRY